MKSHGGSGSPSCRKNQRLCAFNIFFRFCRFFVVLHIFGEVFVDLVPEGCPNPPEGCPKPLGGPPYRALPIGALPIGPYKGPIRALIGPY